jgi:hypothetical protein
MLQGALRLLRSGGSKVVLQLLVHLTHPIGGGCGQHVQKWRAAAPHDQSPWPGLLQAPIHVGAGRLVWPQWPPTQR